MVRCMAGGGAMIPFLHPQSNPCVQYPKSTILNKPYGNTSTVAPNARYKKKGGDKVKANRYLSLFTKISLAT